MLNKTTYMVNGNKPFLYYSQVGRTSRENKINKYLKKVTKSPKKTHKGNKMRLLDEPVDK